ncbi:MAG: PorT family protein [Bacteroidales bacterium]|nr:PorT family protein [Bacteroidales bacterium]MCF8334581.1 PorT family protein [Bacteroidales bacterium]
MKKLITSLILVITATGLMAQFSVGPKIGYTATSLSTDKEEIKEDFDNTLHFGAFARLGGKTYLQPELLFMTRGTEFGYGFQEGAKQNVELKTIDVPLLIGFKLIDLKVADIRAMGGPVGTFTINNDIKATNIGDQVESTLQDDDIKDANWGIQAGVGADFLSLSLDIRYHFGLSSMYEEDFLDQFNTEDVKSNSFLVTLGWKIL